MLCHIKSIAAIETVATTTVAAIDATTATAIKPPTTLYSHLFEVLGYF